MDYERLLLAEGEHWKVYLHQSQVYLGRCYIWAKRDGLVDLMDITIGEREELFRIGSAVREVLRTLFQPDLFNWAALGNISTHCHVHLIPRYREPRRFAGVQFTDERWGQNYVPYDKEFSIPDKALTQIRENMRFPIKLALNTSWERQ